MIDKLLLVRHGETVHNVSGVAQGWSDSELSETGMQQIRKVANRLSSFGVTSIYCSTLPRAMTTARVIGEALGLQCTPLEELRELNCGRWEGLPFAELQKADRELHRRWSVDPTVACPGGESFQDVQGRMQRGIEIVTGLETSEHATPLLVSHGTAIRIAASSLLGLPLAASRSFVQDNAAINVFLNRGDRWALKLWNDTTHCA